MQRRCKTIKSNLVPYAFVWENSKTIEFSETIVVYGRCSYQNEYSHEPIWISKVKVIHWPSSKVTDSIFSNSFSLETPLPTEAKLHVEPPWGGVMKFCSNGPDHITKIAAMAMCNKNLKNPSFSVTIQQWVLEYYKTDSNDDPGLTLTYFTECHIWSLMLLYEKKVKLWNFSETIAVYDIKVGRCSQLNKYMKLYEY